MIPRPLGLTLLLLLLAFWAGAALLTLAAVAWGEGEIVVRGVPTPRAEVLDLLLPMLAPMALAGAGAALGLWLESPWARPAVLFACLLAGPLATYPRWAEATNPGGAAALGLLGSAPVALLLGLYLYRKDNVAAYFRALRQRRGGGPAPNPRGERRAG